ncbi:family 20 glycosylhydrolase [Lewinella sp. 4G2]|uniref:family 20 glycosylhydrolase n=1 Tax=Lewinella sp. 4G2 TaxID=1803372 RepID=UPI0007B4DB42|nr:family 20 glycosylhydrolase [Lewinella sp. 4G2]OAV42749.1 beta-N-acetylhexosaminidase [Lewinella sp. 4G2]
MRLLSLCCLAFLLFSCGGDAIPPAPAMAPLADLPIIPLPFEMSSRDGYLWVDTDGDAAAGNSGADAGAMDYLRSRDLGMLPLATSLDPSLTLPNEAYLLDISAEGITITAKAAAGLLNGAITLVQVVEFSPNTERGIFLPAGTITDQPRYAYRGFMLDVARHFFGVDTVKQVIDRIAPYKINHLHLHLSDDQGWRIEIKSWPGLAEIGGRFEVDGTPGGYYTQEDYTEIVNYAAARGITVVPEIDMPGHTNAALNAYAELNGDGKARDPYFGTKVGFSTLDANKEVTYEFIDDVVREISAITPGPYFHIGGDESSVTPHDDYVKLIRRAQDIVLKHGKKSIGWDEVAVAGLAEGSVVQLWNHTEYALKAKEAGNKVLFSLAKRTYLDMQYDSLSRIGLHWAAYIEVDDAYNWDPGTLVDGLTEKDILGIEAPLWSETVRSLEDIDYLVFPRLPALAEVGWSYQMKRQYAPFVERLKVHQGWLKEQGIGTYDSRVFR